MTSPNQDRGWTDSSLRRPGSASSSGPDVDRLLSDLAALNLRDLDTEGREAVRGQLERLCSGEDRLRLVVRDLYERSLAEREFGPAAAAACELGFGLGESGPRFRTTLLQTMQRSFEAREEMEPARLLNCVVFTGALMDRARLPSGAPYAVLLGALARYLGMLLAGGEPEMEVFAHQVALMGPRLPPADRPQLDDLLTQARSALVSRGTTLSARCRCWLLLALDSACSPPPGRLRAFYRDQLGALAVSRLGWEAAILAEEPQQVSSPCRPSSEVSYADRRSPKPFGDTLEPYPGGTKPYETSIKSEFGDKKTSYDTLNNKTDYGDKSSTLGYDSLNSKTDYGEKKAGYDSLNSKVDYSDKSSTVKSSYDSLNSKVDYGDKSGTIKATYESGKSDYAGDKSSYSYGDKSSATKTGYDPLDSGKSDYGDKKSSYSGKGYDSYRDSKASDDWGKDKTSKVGGYEAYADKSAKSTYGDISSKSTYGTDKPTKSTFDDYGEKATKSAYDSYGEKAAKSDYGSYGDKTTKSTYDTYGDKSSSTSYETSSYGDKTSKGYSTPYAADSTSYKARDYGRSTSEPHPESTRPDIQSRLKKVAVDTEAEGYKSSGYRKSCFPQDDGRADKAWGRTSKTTTGWGHDDRFEKESDFYGEQAPREPSGPRTPRGPRTLRDYDAKKKSPLYDDKKASSWKSGDDTGKKSVGWNSDTQDGGYSRGSKPAPAVAFVSTPTCGEEESWD